MKTTGSVARVPSVPECAAGWSDDAPKATTAVSLHDGRATNAEDTFVDIAARTPTALTGMRARHVVAHSRTP